MFNLLGVYNMDWYPIIIGIVFISAGIFFIFFSRRFLISFGGYKYDHNLNISQEENQKTSTMSKEEFIKTYTEGPGFRHILWVIWLIGIRIIGVMLVIAGFFAILSKTIHC